LGGKDDFGVTRFLSVGLRFVATDAFDLELPEMLDGLLGFLIVTQTSGINAC
jgi:hypothetical protein